MLTLVRLEAIASARVSSVLKESTVKKVPRIQLIVPRDVGVVLEVKVRVTMNTVNKLATFL